MAETLKISVIIPAHNAARFIQQAVESAAMQPEVMEVIAVDDASTDDTWTLLNTLGQSVEKLKIFRLPENMGASVARNKGLDLVTFPYVAFLDADDIYLEDRFKMTRAVFQSHGGCEGVYEATGSKFDDEVLRLNYLKQGHKVLTTISGDDVTPETLFEKLMLNQHGYIHLDGLTLLRESLRRYGLHFDPMLRQTQDTDFILTAALHLKLYPGNISQAVAVRQIHGQNRILNSLQEASEGKIRFTDKWFETMCHNKFSASVNRKIILLKAGIHIPGGNKWWVRFKLVVKVLLMIIRQPMLLSKIFS
ncbi:MAG: glycosyltransferase family 2 protein [Saprospiraceae bacterium]|nr:glycosyltransferase family 2 protein [Saprospiraceae bacterium]